jgi:hypothetical protein
MLEGDKMSKKRGEDHQWHQISYITVSPRSLRATQPLNKVSLASMIIYNE